MSYKPKKENIKKLEVYLKKLKDAGVLQCTGHDKGKPTR